VPISPVGRALACFLWSERHESALMGIGLMSLQHVVEIRRAKHVVRGHGAPKVTESSELVRGASSEIGQCVSTLGDTKDGNDPPGSALLVVHEVIQER
jgi:hypothetical protein